jgi:hypothetical protein
MSRWGWRGVNADLYNRQLHSDEKAAIREKANGDAAEERRLTAAACYVVQCWVEFSPNNSEWLANYVSTEDAKDLGPELQWVSGQKVQSGQGVNQNEQDAIWYCKGLTSWVGWRVASCYACPGSRRISGLDESPPCARTRPSIVRHLFTERGKNCPRIQPARKTSSLPDAFRSLKRSRI